MSTSPNASYVQLAERIRSGKVSDANLKVIRDALAEIESQKARDLEQLRNQFRPEVQLKSGLRPTYLSNCKGNLGQRRGTKYEFFPEPGTRAHERSDGRGWRIPRNCFTDDSQMTIDGQEELLAEARMS